MNRPYWKCSCGDMAYTDTEEAAKAGAACHWVQQLWWPRQCVAEAYGVDGSQLAEVRTAVEANVIRDRYLSPYACCEWGEVGYCDCAPWQREGVALRSGLFRL